MQLVNEPKGILQTLLVLIALLCDLSVGTWPLRQNVSLKKNKDYFKK